MPLSSWFCCFCENFLLIAFTIITDLYYLIQILYRLLESYVHHVATANIPPKMAAGSVISIKRVDGRSVVLRT